MCDVGVCLRHSCSRETCRGWSDRIKRTRNGDFSRVASVSGEHVRLFSYACHVATPSDRSSLSFFSSPTFGAAVDHLLISFSLLLPVHDSSRNTLISTLVPQRSTPATLLRLVHACNRAASSSRHRFPNALLAFFPLPPLVPSSTRDLLAHPTDQPVSQLQPP
jgi:hypothetical protein